MSQPINKSTPPRPPQSLLVNTARRNAQFIPYNAEVICEESASEVENMAIVTFRWKINQMDLGFVELNVYFPWPREGQQLIKPKETKDV